MGEGLTARKQDKEWAAYAGSLADPSSVPFDRQLSRFREIYSGRGEEDGPPVVWSPDPAAAAASNVGRLMSARGDRDYASLHRWSVADRPGFWRAVIDALEIPFATPPGEILEPGSDATDPRWLPGASMNIADACFVADPSAVAVISGSEDGRSLTETTYGELEIMVDAVAAGLQARGLKEGDPVALYMPMNLHCVAAYLGIIRAGCAAVSIADSFPPAGIRRRLEISGARVVITSDHTFRAGKRIELAEKVREAGAGEVIVAGGSSWEELTGSGTAPVAAIGDPGRTVNILFSSGTTAAPKAIPWTHLTPIKCAMDGRFHQDIRTGDVVAWPTNIGWMMGPWLIFAGLMNRATVALFEGAPHGAGFRDFVRDAGVTTLGVIPSLVHAWRHGGLYDDPGWKSLRVISSTGEPSGQEDYLWLMSRAGYRAPIIEYLGGTEIGGGHITGTVVQPASPATFTTPALGIDFVILDEEGAPVPEGSTGELFLIPPAIGLSQRLLNGDHRAVYHEGTPTGPAGAPLRRHGDHVTRLPGGFFRAQGRADDAMNLGGIKISSLEIERVVQTHPAVGECAAVSIQPEGGGSGQLVLFVVSTGSPDAVALKGELGGRISRRLNPLFRIHDLVMVEALPRTASNKVMRRSLRSAYIPEGENGTD